jgi:hypothetical protein
MIASNPDTARRPWRRRLWAWAAATVVAVAALVQVQVLGPRVAVRWAEGLSDATRTALEQRYSLRAGRHDGGQVWRYELGDRSASNIGALVGDPAVADTNYIDRTQLTAAPAAVSVGIRPLPFPLSTDREFQRLDRLFQPQSLCSFIAALALLLAAALDDVRRRRARGVLAVLAFALAAYALPLSPESIDMGDSDTYTSSQKSFESYAGVRDIRYEAHLSYAILGRIYGVLGQSETAPVRALDLLTWIATAWFVLSALGIGFLERWSPQVLRYLGLVLMAPSALLFFGYRELGYLSLSVAAFPLFARGVKAGAPRLEASALLMGVGAALHGFGLLSLAGSCLAALASRASWRERAWTVLRVIAWGTAAYVGWIAVYLIVLNLPVTQGHADAIPWRPWLVDRVVGDRVNAAILSATGMRDLLFTAWVVGAPLLVLVARLRQEHRDEVRLALCYAVPSVAFAIAFWPIQGLGAEMDLVVAAFPAFYALAWLCALDRRATSAAAALLASAHIAFWRILLDGRFLN